MLVALDDEHDLNSTKSMESLPQMIEGDNSFSTFHNLQPNVLLSTITVIELHSCQT
jgi:hypothetical protein